MTPQTPRDLSGEPSPFAGTIPPAEAGAEEGHLLVRVGAEWFAVALRDAEEAIESPVLRELALGPVGCVGALWWREQHLPVHAAPALGVMPEYPPRAVLVLAGEPSPPVAIAVDDVADVVPLVREQLRRLTGLRDPFAVVEGVVWHDGRLVTVVSAAALAASLTQGAAQQRREVA